LVHAHSGWRYLVLLLLGVTLLVLIAGWWRARPWGAVPKRLLLITTILLDVQVTLGVAMFLIQKAWQIPLFLEHTVTMLLGLALAHVANVRARKSKDAAGQYRQAFLWLLGAAVLVGLGVWRITTGR
jgi:Na+/citrate or Na+/malate symporter